MEYVKLKSRLPDLSTPTKRNLPIPPLLQLLVTLRFLGTGATHILVGDDVKISRSTTGRCIRQVSALIANLAPNYISFFKGRSGAPSDAGVCTYCRFLLR
uniref:Nuclease HARBI1 n=1 Tax=Magallana gigas TaxID=29159 RepID=A0A8W8NZQ0_MAGGI